MSAAAQTVSTLAAVLQPAPGGSLRAANACDPAALVAPTCRCGAAGELRRCNANGGIAWRCSRCLRMLSDWIGRSRLIGIDIGALPDWNAPHRNDRQRELLL